MSYVYVGKLWLAYPGGPVERAVLLALASYMSYEDPDRPVFPSVETLASLAGYSTRRVKAALKVLRAEGWIVPTGSTRGGRQAGHAAGMATRYRVLVAKCDEMPDRRNGAPDAPLTVQDAHPSKSRVHERTVKGAKSDHSRVHVVHPKLGFKYEVGLLNEGRVAADASPPLPNWISKTVWAEFKEYRRRRGGSVTATQDRHLITRLSRWRDNADEVLRVAMRHGWLVPMDPDPNVRYRRDDY